MSNKQQIFNIRKNFLILLKKEYDIIKEKYDLEQYNYNHKIEYDNLKRYIDGFLLLNDIENEYFYDLPQYITENINIDNIQIINKIIAKLWSFDTNRFLNIIDFKINLQEKITNSNIKDNSPYPLFNYLNEDKFKLSSYKYFFKVCSLFTKNIGITEEQTHYKTIVINKFINVIYNTRVFVYLYNVLRQLNILEHFSDLPLYIYNLWFDTYSKKAKDDSCLFEHIFIGEMSDDKILGLHNWIQFYNEEKIGRINYYGHYNTIIDYPHILNMKFSWENKIKHKSSFLIGTSVEFEMALYTLLNIFTKSDSIKINYNNIDVTFKIIRRDKNLITIYPML